MREGDGTTPKMVKWWHNDGAVIDFTNPHAVDWYTSRLRALQTNYGVDSFKFDAGEYMYTPPAPRTTFAPLNATMDFSRLYLSVAAEFAPLAEVRSGYDTQDLPIFVREFDKDSTWSTDNGLQALVTGALTFGVLGYPFVLPGAFVSQPRASCLLERTLSRGHHLMFGGWFLWHSLPCAPLQTWCVLVRRLCGLLVRRAGVATRWPYMPCGPHLVGRLEETPTPTRLATSLETILRGSCTVAGQWCVVAARRPSLTRARVTSDRWSRCITAHHPCGHMRTRATRPTLFSPPCSSRSHRGTTMPRRLRCASKQPPYTQHTRR